MQNDVLITLAEASKLLKKAVGPDYKTGIRALSGNRHLFLFNEDKCKVFRTLIYTCEGITRMHKPMLEPAANPNPVPVLMVFKVEVEEFIEGYKTD